MLKSDRAWFLWEIGYFAFFGKCWHMIFLKAMGFLIILDFPSQTSCLAKFLFLSYQPKCSWPIRLYVSLKCNFSRKNCGIKLIFCLWKNIISTWWYYCLWWAWPGMAKVLKITSLQYLWNIFKKRWGIRPY